ncbi:MAG TPA: choice-of-anchor J domain-containing protein [Chitinophagaceae bacterium]|nr:choice-of-anchor J domain-containing protein [Chitinophagaceae bacterium]
MRNSTLRKVLLFSALTVITLQACRKDDAAMMTPPGVPDQSFLEEFDTTTSAFARGWVPINASAPKGRSVWVQGLFNNPANTGLPYPIPFGPHSSKGSYPGFIGADYLSTSAAAGVISNWLVSPVVTMQNGDKIIFYTRTALYAISATDSTDFANRLQVRLNSNNEGTNVGNGLNTGDFTNTLLDINPSYIETHTNPALYDPNSYPFRWTRFEATVGGLNGPTKGRFAFRYFVEGGGSNGLGSAVAVDSVAYVGKR